MWCQHPLTVLDFLADDSPGRLPKEFQTFAWLGLREIDLSNLQLRFINSRPVLIGDYICPNIGERNELPGSDLDSIQPLKPFFIAKKGL